MQGPVAGDPASLPVGVDQLPASTPFTRIIAMTRTSDLGDVPEEMESLLREAVASLASLLRASVAWREPGTMFDGHDPDLDWFRVAPAEHLAAIGRVKVQAAMSRMHPSSREFFAAALDVGIDEYLAARRRRFDYARTVSKLLAGNALLVTCTNGLPGWNADGSIGDGTSLLPPAAFNTALFNITGHPALSLPFGQLPNGLPFGFQIVAPHWRDADLLAIAGMWQRENPWPTVAHGYSEFTAYLD
jgi:Asp-tRNA(Asn)/Glu-tRNA(Gln) amidotransferase A subunit family amidase